MVTQEIDEQIIVAGFGGQGVMLTGKIITQAGMLEGFHATWIPKYGSEVRGGTAHCMVRISSQEIASPLVDSPFTLIAMNKLSLLKFEPLVAKGGVIIINSSMVDDQVTRKDVKAYYIPANELALEIGDVRGANMVTLGAYLRRRPFLEMKIVLQALHDILPPYRHKYIPLNERAIIKGSEFETK